MVRVVPLTAVLVLVALAAYTTAYQPQNRRCYEIKDTGPCFAYFQRFYFDRYARQCKPFIYGGCEGNNNNFETFYECQKYCQ